MPSPGASARRVALVAALAPAVGAPARAPLTLTLRAPGGCPGRDEVVAAVERLLGEPSPGRLAVSAAIVIEPAGHERFRLRMDTRTGGLSGQRVLEGPSCRAVVDSAALVLALMIDDEAVAAQAASSAPASATSAPPPAPPPAPPAPVEPAPAASARPDRVRAWRGEIAVAAVAEAGALPGAGLGAQLAGGVAGERGRVGARLVHLPPRERRLPSRPGTGGDFGLTAAAVEGCLRPSPGWPWGCAGAELARVTGVGVGVSEPGEASGWLPSVHLGAQGAWPSGGRLGVQVGAEARWQLDRPRFALEGPGRVFEPGRLGGRAWAGLRLLF